MIHIDLMMKDTATLGMLGAYLLIAFILAVHQFRLYKRHESNYKVYVLIITVVTIIAGVLHANSVSVGDTRVHFIELIILLFVEYSIMYTSYKFISHTEYRKVEATASMVVVFTLMIATFTFIYPVTINKDSDKVVKEVQTEQPEKIVEDGSKIEKPIVTVDANCDSEDADFFTSCYDTYDEYKSVAYAEDAIIHKYNNDRKKLSMQKAVLSEAKEKVSFLEKFIIELEKENKENSLNPIVKELLSQTKEDIALYTESVPLVEETVKVLEQQLKADEGQVKGVKTMIEEVEDMPTTFTLKDFVFSTFPMSDKDLITPTVKDWIRTQLGDE